MPTMRTTSTHGRWRTASTTHLQAIASATSPPDAVDALVDAMLEDADLTPGALERALEARGMDTGRLCDLWVEAEQIVAEQAGWDDGFPT